MSRAFYLASLGKYLTSPNPRVGCVIVKQDRIIAEGWHHVYGEAHAEACAVQRVFSKEALKGAEVYVTLSPCTHHGKTPSCADLLVTSGVSKVYAAVQDTNPLANQNANIWQHAGIELVTPTHPWQGYFANRRFFTHGVAKRPYIILKWAQTQDGYMAREDYQPAVISNAAAHLLTHTWRAEEDAIWVGYRTALHDNPALTTRYVAGKNPLRIILDKDNNLPYEGHLFQDGLPTWVFTTQTLTQTTAPQAFPAVRHIPMGDFQLTQALQYLAKQQVLSVLVEGGRDTLHDFITQGLWDEARVFTSQDVWEKGVKAPDLGKRKEANLWKCEHIAGNELRTYGHAKAPWNEWGSNC